MRCIVLPLTVQLPLALNVTPRPELAVAPTLKSGSATVRSPRGLKVIVCAALNTAEGLKASTVAELKPPTAYSVQLLAATPNPGRGGAIDGLDRQPSVPG